jgi:hypothetical protein
VTIARREPAGIQIEVRVPLAQAIGGFSADRARSI